jgi:hypothetical protein
MNATLCTHETPSLRAAPMRAGRRHALRTLSCGLALSLMASSSTRADNVDIVYLDSFEDGCGNLIHSEPFAIADDSAWPAPWGALGNVQSADIQQGMARLQPDATGYSLARMGAEVDTRNVEVRFTLRFEDASSQGVGFYVRQNGGYLQNTTTHGQGYAAFAEGSFRGTSGIGVWREIDGVEQQIGHQPPPYPTITAGIDYRVRFQVLQADATQTLVRAKMWPTAESEPATWQTSANDASVELQNISGGIAVDSWSNYVAPPITAHTFIDNLELISLCPFLP